MSLAQASPFDLHGKAVLVTGGNSGIGLGMAEALAAAGASVAIWGTNEAKNAVGRFCELVLDQWRDLMRVNLDGAFLTFQAAARRMAAAGGGSLIAVSSIMGTRRAFGRAAPYATAKAGLTGLVRSAALDLRRDGIRVNAILPGFITTALADPMLTDERFAGQSLPRLLGRRWGTPEDLGGLAVFLASDASRYMTGEEIVIDGGFVLSRPKESPPCTCVPKRTCPAPKPRATRCGSTSRRPACGC